MENDQTRTCASRPTRTLTILFQMHFEQKRKKRNRSRHRRQRRTRENSSFLSHVEEKASFVVFSLHVDRIDWISAGLTEREEVGQSSLQMIHNTSTSTSAMLGTRRSLMLVSDPSGNELDIVQIRRVDTAFPYQSIKTRSVG